MQQSSENDKLELTEMFNNYSKAFPSKLDIIEHLLATYSLDKNKDTLLELRRSVHSLRGSSNQYGYEQVGKLATNIESQLDSLLENEAVQTDLSPLKKNIQNLRTLYISTQKNEALSIFLKKNLITHEE